MGDLTSCHLGRGLGFRRRRRGRDLRGGRRGLAGRGRRGITHRGHRVHRAARCGLFEMRIFIPLSDEISIESTVDSSRMSISFFT